MRIHDKFDMTGKVVLVTGAAGHVARKAIIPTLEELGAELILTDINQEKLFPIANGKHRWIKADLSELRFSHHCSYGGIPGIGGAGGLVDFVHTSGGKLDVLINNAAVTGATGLPKWAVPFAEQSDESWDRSLSVNLLAPMILSQRLAPLLAEGDGGAILNVSSIHGVGGPVWSTYEGTEMGCPAAYAAAKGGLVQLTKYLATTLAPKVRVNALTPGGIARGQAESFVKRYLERVPLGRMETEDDLAGAIAFLCSDASAYMTGHNLIVDGGWCAW